MNKQRIELVGRVVAKPELQKSKNKKSYTKLRIAVNDKRTDKSGEEVDNVTYYDLLNFDKRAEATERLDKGQLIRSVGDLSVETYITKDGEPKAGLTVFTRELQVFDPEIFLNQ